MIRNALTSNIMVTGDRENPGFLLFFDMWVFTLPDDNFSDVSAKRRPNATTTRTATAKTRRPAGPGKRGKTVSPVAFRGKTGQKAAMKTKALLVHLLTATGAVFAMLAMLAAVDGKWSLMFLWLVVAFAVDGIDGPLARKYNVKTNAPQYDGVLLDLIIDYLTYVFVPAFALFKSGLLPDWTGWIVIITITFTSALYFADTRMKTRDNSFSGFPGCWNMVVLVLFALQPNYWIMLALVVALSITMFIPLKFIHPVRTERWRIVSLPVTFAWVVFAGWAAWVDFHPQSWAHWGLNLTSLYLIGAGIAQQLIPARSA
jgi:phosphatidylcholine synthase